MPNVTINGTAFALKKIAKPRFEASQIKVDESKHVRNSGIPKPTRKLVVAEFGKIGCVQR